MVKIEDAHKIHLKMRGKRAELSLVEYEPSLDEWNHVRTAAFARLREDGFVPKELLDLVEHFEERTVIQPLSYKTADGAGLRLGIQVPGKKTKKTTNEKIAEIREWVALGRRMLADDKKDKTELTASEGLAFLLRICLRELKHAEKTRNAAPVRKQQLVPRSVIAEVATDLLGSCELWNYVPGQHLNALISELLNVDRVKHWARHVDGQNQASFIIAQNPKVHTRELARRLDVNASTISRWRRSPEFKEKVERTARWIARLKSSGRWEEMIASAERE
jgi:hypothetical protein